jgi:hypothetical protein
LRDGPWRRPFCSIGRPLPLPSLSAVVCVQASRRRRGSGRGSGPGSWRWPLSLSYAVFRNRDLPSRRGCGARRLVRGRRARHETIPTQVRRAHYSVPAGNLFRHAVLHLTLCCRGQQPGWNEYSVGYHGDDGNIYYGDGSSGMPYGEVSGTLPPCFPCAIPRAPLFPIPNHRLLTHKPARPLAVGTRLGVVSLSSAKKSQCRAGPRCTAPGCAVPSSSPKMGE